MYVCLVRVCACRDVNAISCYVLRYPVFRVCVVPLSPNCHVAAAKYRTALSVFPGNGHALASYGMALMLVADVASNRDVRDPCVCMCVNACVCVCVFVAHTIALRHRTSNRRESFWRWRAISTSARCLPATTSRTTASSATGHLRSKTLHNYAPISKKSGDSLRHAICVLGRF